MKRLLFAVVLAALPGAAQWRPFGYEPVRPAGFVGIGVSAPVNPLAQAVHPGWNLAGGIGVTGRYVGVLADLMFTDFGLNDRTLQLAGASRGSRKYWAITVDPVFHVNQRGPVDFYLTGGGGLYARSTRYYLPYGTGGPFSDAAQLLASYTVYKPGVDGGAGFAYNVGYRSRMKVFVEARYHHMFTRGSGTSFIPITVGVRF